VRDEADQARFIVERVLENREGGSLLKHQAVLFRTSSHSGPLEIELTRRNIPFVKFGGLKFLEAAHVKDMLSLLRFVENPRDRVCRLSHSSSATRRLDRRPRNVSSTACRIPRSDRHPLRPALSAPLRDDWTAFIHTIANLRTLNGR